MIWILSSIAIILGVLLGVWFTKLPIKYRILEETDGFGNIRYYPECKQKLTWDKYIKKKIYEFGTKYKYIDIWFYTYDEAKKFIIHEKLLAENDKKSRKISRRKLTV